MDRKIRVVNRVNVKVTVIITITMVREVEVAEKTDLKLVFIMIRPVEPIRRTVAMAEDFCHCLK